MGTFHTIRDNYGRQLKRKMFIDSEFTDCLIAARRIAYESRLDYKDIRIERIDSKTLRIVKTFKLQVKSYGISVNPFDY